MAAVWPMRRLSAVRQILWRNSVAALVATGCDAACYQWGLRVALWDPGLATALGAVVGGVVNYGLNRVWTFGSRQKKMPQMLRYAGVCALGGVISSVAVHLWAWAAPDASAVVIWLVVKCAASWGYSLPMQRFYVFKSASADELARAKTPRPG